MATFALHFATAGRYGFFRDELYFIACGRHPAWGYVDQPSLVPWIAAASQAFGHSLVVIRVGGGDVPRPFQRAYHRAVRVWLLHGRRRPLARDWPQFRNYS